MDYASASVSRACLLTSLAYIARLWVLTFIVATMQGLQPARGGLGRDLRSQLGVGCCGAAQGPAHSVQRAPAANLARNPCWGLAECATQLRLSGGTASRYAANSDLQQDGVLVMLMYQRCCWDGLLWVLVEGLTGYAPA